MKAVFNGSLASIYPVLERTEGFRKVVLFSQAYPTDIYLLRIDYGMLIQAMMLREGEAFEAKDGRLIWDGSKQPIPVKEPELQIYDLSDNDGDSGGEFVLT